MSFDVHDNLLGGHMLDKQQDWQVCNGLGLIVSYGVSCTVKVVEQQESASTGGSESAGNESRLVAYPRCSSVF